MRPSMVSLGMTAFLLLWLVSDAPGAEPSLPPTIIGQDGAEMVLVPAGEFPMGSEAAEGDFFAMNRQGKQVGMVEVTL